MTILQSETAYSEYVNPQWARLLDLLQMNVRYERCSGCELFTADGRRILDFLPGYCVHNVGHNHPTVVAALREELESCGPAMVQTHVSDRAGELAEKLCRRAGGRLAKVFFGSSGSEGVEAAIKFARVHTGRSGLVYAKGAFHGYVNLQRERPRDARRAGELGRSGEREPGRSRARGRRDAAVPPAGGAAGL